MPLHGVPSGLLSTSFMVIYVFLETYRAVNFRTESRLEEFKKRFRRSGSLGVPFFPEEDVRSLKASGILQTFRNNLGQLQSQVAIEEDDEEEGTGVITVIVKSSKSASTLQLMLQAIPVKRIFSEKTHCYRRIAG